MSYSSRNSSQYNRPQDKKYSPQEDYYSEDRRSSRHEDARRSSYKAEPKVSIPHMRYKLSKRTQAQTLSEIAMKTSGFYDMSVNEANWVQRDVRSREFSSFSRLPVPRNCDDSIIQKIIGNDNYYLKLTTKTHDMDLIYYDDYDTKEFQFWGEYQCCIKAMNEIRYRIQKVLTREGVLDSENNYREDTYQEDNYRDQKVQNEFDIYDFDTRRHPSKSYYEDDSSSYRPDVSFGQWHMYPAPSDENHSDDEYEAPNDEEPVITDFEPKEQYSDVSKAQMSKMGYEEGTGLGLSQKGRLVPIDPIEELGGRTYNRHFGFGYTGCAPVPEQVQEQVQVEEAPVPVTVEVEEEQTVLVETTAPVTVEEQQPAPVEVPPAHEIVPFKEDDIIEANLAYINEPQPKIHISRSISINTSCNNQ